MFRLPDSLFITTRGCGDLKAQLNESPIALSVNIQNWQLYKSGIFDNCGSDLTHDILLVGMDESSWRLKNSWGVTWGENGYIRLKTGDTCGICSDFGIGFLII